jgi:hypothetical protein
MPCGGDSVRSLKSTQVGIETGSTCTAGLSSCTIRPSCSCVRGICILALLPEFVPFVTVDARNAEPFQTRLAE